MVGNSTALFSHKHTHTHTHTHTHPAGQQIFVATYENKRASLIAQLVKNPPAMQETPAGFLGWEDALEKG